MLNQLDEDRVTETNMSQFLSVATVPHMMQFGLFGPMTKPGDDPRMRPATKSPADKDHFGFSGFRKRKSDDFEESDEFYEAAFKVAEAAEQVYEADMEAEMWRVSDEAERKERHPSPSLLLSCSPPLLHPHPHHHHHAHTYTSQVVREAMSKATIQKLEKDNIQAEKEYSDEQEASKPPSKKYSAKVVDLTMEQE